MAIKNNRLLLLSIFASFVFILLVILNMSGMQEASFLCAELGGTPQVERSFLSVNWQLSCTR